jgi:hypothetical protein
MRGHTREHDRHPPVRSKRSAPMSYARTLLSRGEEVVFESRQHWFAVVAHTWGFIIAAILALAVAIWAASRPNSESLGTLGQIIEIAALLVLLGSLARIGLIVWAWRNQEWLVTNRRIIKSQGILNKSMGDSSLEKVNDAILSQSMIGRLVGYGNLDILTAAEEPSSVSDFPMLADAVQFKIAMLNQKHALEFPDEAPPPVQRPAAPPLMQRPAPMPPRAGSDRVQEVRPEPEPAAAPAPSSEPVATPATAATPAEDAASTLERLAGLRDRGLITPEEYEAKKRDILERM